MVVNKITNINKEQLEKIVKSLVKEQAIFMKFTADWCGPCKTIKPECDKLVNLCSENIYYIEIDVDESVELFAFFKKQKLLKGIPAMYLYYGRDRSEDDKWYLPDYSVLGADKCQLNVLAAKLSTYILLPEEQG
jgi:thiol-disulfide isomerase/thioredoxin